MHLAPEDVEQEQQDQSNQHLVPKRDGLRTVNAPGLPANLRKMQVVWRGVHEFQGDGRAWFIGHLIQYLANSGPELPIGPFLWFRANTVNVSDLEQNIRQERA
jgi:hypothetical protein